MNDPFETLFPQEPKLFTNFKVLRTRRQVLAKLYDKYNNLTYYIWGFLKKIWMN